MTKLNRTNASTVTRNGGARVRNTTPAVPAAMIPLKTLLNDIIRDNATFTRTAKQMRVALRANFADIHYKNSSWDFTPAQYDRVRSHFDAKYAARLARAAKPRTNKRNAKSPVADTPVTVAA